MITNSGKEALKRFFVGGSGQPVSEIALGVGGRTPAATDTSLQLEVVRIPVAVINSDTGTDRVVFKSTLSAGAIGVIHEVGIFGGTDSPNLGRNLNVINPDMATWTNSTLSPSNARAGSQTRRVDFVANGTTTATVSGLAENLSELADTDQIVIGYYATTNVSSLRFRLGTDATNYFEYLVTAPPVGYNVARFNKSAATITGAPTWETIEQFVVRPSATAAGSGNVFLDSVRLESPYDNLIARTTLATPVVADPTVVTDVEFALNLSFSDAA